MSKTAAKSKPEPSSSVSAQDEVERLKAELRGMEILLQQNAALEKEVERLNSELGEATLGVQKKGYLYKWREREIYYAAKWGLRYFVLQGSKISYYGNEHENRPRRTIDLSNCYIRDEGKKKGYHMFSIYLGETTCSDADNPLDSSLLLRLSSESSAEAMQWIDMLEQGCALNDGSFPPLNTPLPSFGHNVSQLAETQSGETSPTSPGRLKSTVGGSGNCSPGKERSGDDGDWGHHDLTETTDPDPLSPALTGSQIPMVTLQRVRSSTKVLQMSQSRQSFARRLLGNRAAAVSSMKDGSASPTRGAGTAKRTKGKGIHKSFPAFKPMHVQVQTSPLSPDISKVDHNFRGFFNLGVIILLISHMEMIMTNLMKYGFKAGLPSLEWIASSLNMQWSPHATANIQYLAIALATWSLPVIISYLVETLAANFKVNERLILAINFFMGTFNIVMPCMIVWYADASPGMSMLYLLQAVIIWMKLISYAHANRGLRRSSRKIKREDMENSANESTSNNSKVPPAGLGSRQSSTDDIYSDNNAKPYSDQMQLLLAECKDLQPPFLLYPQNISMGNLAWFMIAPTLCYQLNYPRTPSIRWGKVMFIVVRLFFNAAIIIFAVQQYMVPTLEEVLSPMQKRDVLLIFDRLLKLSIPNTYVWLLGFYLFFHLWLNLLAELTRFGDRLFYKEWWNARTIDEYWRTWNMPVHHWVTRHLYFPLIRMGWSKTFATLMAFMFSAVMHELIISIPFRYIAGHAFVGMLAQAPLIMITKYMDRRYDNAFIGNAVFWCSFCIFGQPMGIILYYFDLWKAAQTGAI